MIKVLVVDDSSTVRQLLVHTLDSDPEIEVIGEAADGRQAVELVESLRPSLVTMDVVMPDMDGLEATRRIMAARPTPILIVTAYVDFGKLDVVFEAMKAGALDVVNKPVGFGTEDLEGWEKNLVVKVKELARISVQQIE